jgi:NAD+ synthase (glutamine-hydrolysing)
MRSLRIGLAQINPTVGDLDGNFEKISAAIGRAREQSVELLAFPEMAITGYPPEDLLLKPSFIDRAIERTHDLLPQTSGMTVVVGTIEREDDLYNAAAVLHDGKWAGAYRKRYLPNYGVFDENRYFMAATSSPVFVRDRTVVGVNVCEDIWYPGGPVMEEQVIRGGAEVLLNISASPYHSGKSQARQRMLSTRASDNLVVLCYVNLVGGQDEVVYDGASLIIDGEGNVLAEGAMFAEDLIVADVDLDEVFNQRLHDPRLRKGRSFDNGEPAARIELPPLASAAKKAPLARRAPARELELVEEVYEALVTGTRDYVQKNGFDSVVLGLSGGVDSALTAAIAADALGAGKVAGVAMPSRFTSGASKEDAESLARALGLRFYSIPIEQVFESYLRSLEPALSGRKPDITEENLQARIRGNYLMALSNKFGWLVLTTGNKSEYSVGYATLYGDMAGGFAVLKDVYKTFVYELSRYRNTRGAVIPENTFTRAPSAELRDGQTDQDSLPPYEVLDPILREYVEEDRSIREIAAMGYDLEIVQRVVRMVDRAEYKRRQSPPGVKITQRAFGKDRRLPITNRWRG